MIFNNPSTGSRRLNDTSRIVLRYDTIYLRALKNWRDGQSTLETKNKEKTKNRNRVAQKKRSGQKSVKAVWEEEVKLRRGVKLRFICMQILGNIFDECEFKRFYVAEMTLLSH